jgi:hypothetical protein
MKRIDLDKIISEMRENPPAPKDIRTGWLMATAEIQTKLDKLKKVQ